MSLRLKCATCRAVFLAPEGEAGPTRNCPKCGAGQVIPGSAPSPPAPPSSGPSSTAKGPQVPPPPPTPEEVVFVPASDAPRSRSRRSLYRGLALLFLALALATAVALPRLRDWWSPIPPDPIEVIASRFLQARVDGDNEVAQQLSTVEEPPAIRSFRRVVHRNGADRRLKGSFRPIAQFHTKVNETFEYDPAIGRFQARNPLGPAAETLDALHEARAKAEQSDLFKKMQSGDPNDIFEAAESLGGAIGKLAEGVLAPKKLVPTYKQLVLDARPPLAEPARELALDFAGNQATWDALLKRPFPTLKADGPFLLDRAYVAAEATDALASAGDPPTLLDLELVRFRLEGIDTGWKVISARRREPGGAAPGVATPSEGSNEPPDRTRAVPPLDSSGASPRSF